MTLLKIFALEDDKEENISVLSEGEHIIGRGVLNCHDKRVSRKHAVISVCKDLVTLKAIHVNPCFFKAAEGNSITIISKDTSVVLNDGDQFALLASLFWFKVKLDKNNGGNKIEGELSTSCIPKIKMEDSSECDNNNKLIKTKRANTENSLSENPKRSKTSDADDNTKQNITQELKDPNCSTNLDPLNSSSNVQPVSAPDFIENIDPCKLIDNINNIIEEDYGPKEEESILQEEKVLTTKIEERNLKKEDTKTDDIKLNVSNSNGSKLDTDSEPKGTNVEENSAVENEEISEIVNNNHIIKEEPQDKMQENKDDKTLIDKDQNQNKASCSTNNKNTRRERCWYGPNCYRKNPIHRADFSHPGDNDYDSDPDDDRPICPFGVTCYRKNLDHRRSYKHCNPPAPKPNNTTKKQKRKRNSPKKNDDSDDDDGDSDSGSALNNKVRRKASMKKKDYCEDSPDDYDYNDPFIDDASSDEFQLSSDGDDSTDWEDSQKVDEESQETRRLLKEAKRFTGTRHKNSGN